MPPKKKPIYAEGETGSPGLKQHGGFVSEEWHRSLQGTSANKVYREMSDNHPIIGGVMTLVDWLIRGVDFHVEAAEDTPEHQRVAEFVQESLDGIRCGFRSVISDAMSMMVFGWAYLEKVYKRRADGKIVWDKIEGRAQETLFRWEFDDNDNLLGMVQMAPPRYRQVFIPAEKAIHLVTRPHKRNPEGRSLLRNAYTSYYYQKNLQFVEAVGAERNLAGIPVMEAPPEIMAPNAATAEAAIRTQLQNLVQRIKQDQHAGLVIPAEVDRDGKQTGYRFRLISSSGKNPGELDAIIRRYDSRIAISLMSEFLLLGQDKVGSFALSSDKTAMFSMAISSLLDIVIEGFNCDAIPELLELNGIPASLKPTMVHGDIESANLPELASYVSSLVGVGAIEMDDGLEDYLREQASIPKKVEHPIVDTVPDPADNDGNAPEDPKR